MLLEYAVEPKAIGSSWENFRYLIEKFGFDRGRLIAQYPTNWYRLVYDEALGLKPVEKKRLEVALRKAKRDKIIKTRRHYDGQLTWLPNAITCQETNPFHAIIASENDDGNECVIIVDDADEIHPLLACSHNWEVQRTGEAIAGAIAPLLRSAQKLLLIDPFFNLEDNRYLETLRVCLEKAVENRPGNICCEIHYREHDTRPPMDLVLQRSSRSIADILPENTSICIFGWFEKPNGADFHARYLITDRGGVNIEAGFSAEGDHQSVDISLLGFALCDARLKAFSKDSTEFNLVRPVYELFSDGHFNKHLV